MTRELGEWLSPCSLTHLYQVTGQSSLFTGQVFPHGWLHPFLVINEHLRGVDRVDGDIPHHSEVTTVVQMLILHSEEVPHKPAEHLQDCQHTSQDVPFQNFRASIPHRDVEGP